MAKFPCPKCSANRENNDQICINCGWAPNLQAKVGKEKETFSIPERAQNDREEFEFPSVENAYKPSGKISFITIPVMLFLGGMISLVGGYLIGLALPSINTLVFMKGSFWWGLGVLLRIVLV
jgi:hypothetical protein